jgi:flagellar basal-body rod protein FlgG
MNRALAAAASGMNAQQTNLDVVAANLANADVPGFKAQVATFGALGAGTVQTGTHAVFAQGKLMRSGGPFDIALDGPGLFVVERDGKRAYTRAGSFARAADGSVRNDEGWCLAGVRVPSDAATVGVDAAGRVTITTLQGAHRAAGRIAVAAFDAPEDLRAIGSALYSATTESGPPRALHPGGAHGPAVAFGMLERSNVSIVEAMMQILTAQRAYEANAKGVQAADEMLRIANNLHR